LLITCYSDSVCEMGYFYLMPPAPENNLYVSQKWGPNQVTNYIHADDMHIPYVEDDRAAKYLERAVIAERTFMTDYRRVFDTEYGHDMDAEGYLIGIECSLPHRSFIELVRNQACQVIRTAWRDKVYHLVTLDFPDKVFNPGNILYPLTAREDAFVIVQLEVPEKPGHTNASGKDGQPIATIKALLTARDDIYPLDYLLRPEFYLVIRS